ncbi:hypothetical protein A2U01_0071133, partial [Trifolium medium]|nr:hypothetical protein [Trifolium medium]
LAASNLFFKPCKITLLADSAWSFACGCSTDVKLSFIPPFLAEISYARAGKLCSIVSYQHCRETKPAYNLLPVELSDPFRRDGGHWFHFYPLSEVVHSNY